MRESATGRKYPIDKYPNHGMRGKTQSEEWCKQQSIKMTGENHPMYEKHQTEESKRQMSESSKGQIPWNKDKKGCQVAWNKDKKFPEFSGKNHWNWQDGKSFEPYGLDFNRRFKESIRARDNHCCVICNKPQEELTELLSVHHVDYNKRNNFSQNCASLCRHDHLRTNINRKSWTLFFQSLLHERYGYEYTEDQKIILDFMENK